MDVRGQDAVDKNVARSRTMDELDDCDIGAWLASRDGCSVGSLWQIVERLFG